MSLFIILIVVLTTNCFLNEDPTHYEKYLSNFTYYDLETHDTSILTYYVNTQISKICYFSKNNDDSLSTNERVGFYHIDNNCYKVKWKNDTVYSCKLCNKTLSDMNFLEDIFSRIFLYLGIWNCASERNENKTYSSLQIDKCNAFTSHFGDMCYKEFKDKKKPYSIEYAYWKKNKKYSNNGNPNSETIVIAKFLNFSFGKDCFDDESIFKLPIDKQKCI